MELRGFPRHHDIIDWDLSLDDGRTVAWVITDVWKQIDQLVLLPGSSDEERLAAVRHAAAHASHYAVHRQRANSILTHTLRGNRSDQLSAVSMWQPDIPEHIAAENEASLRQALIEIGVDIIDAVVATEEEALQLALSDARFSELALRFALGPYTNYSQLREVTFTIDGDDQSFTGWKSLERPRPGNSWDLYVVPSYHPVMQSGRRAENLINGGTEAVIRADAINSVSAPYGSIRQDPDIALWQDSWNYVTHPVRATGSTIRIRLSCSKVLSQAGIEEIISLLEQLLELNGTYLAISGGFTGLISNARNIYHRGGIHLTSGRSEPRGSEAWCVWAYRVLEQEKCLDDSYVPAWLLNEGWLEAYDGKPLSS